jgi:hypothetical protein
VRVFFFVFCFRCFFCCGVFEFVWEVRGGGEWWRQVCWCVEAEWGVRRLLWLWLMPLGPRRGPLRNSRVRCKGGSARSVEPRTPCLVGSAGILLVNCPRSLCYCMQWPLRLNVYERYLFWLFSVLFHDVLLMLLKFFRILRFACFAT